MAINLSILSQPRSLPLKIGRGVALALACVGSVAGIGLFAAIALWWVASLLWPGEMNRSLSQKFSRPQTLWLFIGLAGWSLAGSWLGSQHGLQARIVVSVLALPVFIGAASALLGFHRSQSTDQ